MKLTLYSCYDLDQATSDDFERRVAIGERPTVGQWIWMNPDSLSGEWEVVSTHLYKPDQSSIVESICHAAVAKPGVNPDPEFGMVDPEFPNMTITIYLLDGKVYTYSVASCDMAPTLGAFDEYEPYGSRRLPDTKQIDSYQTYTSVLGAPYLKIYVASMSHIRQPVAA